jgi:hypothetical protein
MVVVVHKENSRLGEQWKAEVQLIKVNTTVVHWFCATTFACLLTLDGNNRVRSLTPKDP